MRKEKFLFFTLLFSVVLSFLLVIVTSYYHLQFTKKIEEAKEEILLIEKDKRELLKRIEKDKIEKDKIMKEKIKDIEVLQLWEKEKEKLNKYFQ